LGNDRWQGTFRPSTLGRWDLRVDGWVDRFGTWSDATRVKRAAGVDIDVELTQGAELLESIAERRDDGAAAPVRAAVEAFRRGEPGGWLDDDQLADVVRQRLDRAPV